MVCKVLDGVHRRVRSQQWTLRYLGGVGAAPASGPGVSTMFVNGLPSLHHVSIKVNGFRLIEVKSILHLPGWMVLGNEQGVHVPTGGLDVIINKFREAHLKENRPYALNERLHWMAPPRFGRRRIQRYVEGFEDRCFPFTTLQEFRGDVGDNLSDLDIVNWKVLAFFREGKVNALAFISFHKVPTA